LLAVAQVGTQVGQVGEEEGAETEDEQVCGPVEQDIARQ
jgi:hypothetical protein